MLQSTPVASGADVYAGPCGLFLWLVLAGVLLGGCSKENSEEGTAPAVIHSYTTRGRVAMLPDLTNPTSELRIHHEAIDDFKHGDGSPAPMKSMTMPFPPGPGVSLDGLAVGDVVEFTFDVQWEPTPGMSVTAIRKLPGDTGLQFDVASNGGGDHGGHASGSPDNH